MLPLSNAVHTKHISNATHTFTGQVLWCSACFEPSRRLCLLQAARGIEKSLLEADLPAGKLWRMCTQGQEAGKENVGCAQSHFCCTWSHPPPERRHGAVPGTLWQRLGAQQPVMVPSNLAKGTARCLHCPLCGASLSLRMGPIWYQRLSACTLGFALICRLQHDPCLVQALDSLLLSAACCSGLRAHPVVAAGLPLRWFRF